MRADVIVIGGGIVGLATARAVGRAAPGSTVVVLEKEPTLASHQTGRNSGVIHSGIYYRPGSAKAKLCASGREALLRYVQERGIAHDVCGKVIVATTAAEEEALPGLAERARENGVAVEALDRAGVQELEPHVDARSGLHVPGTGIVDFMAVAGAFAEDIMEAGGEVRASTPVRAVQRTPDGVRVETDAGNLSAGLVVNCAGLQSDLFANVGRARPEARIVPFRGEYFELVPDACGLVNNLVYPVPDPRFPFLGVHLTRMIHGGVHVGPNAVLALAREGYTWGDVDLRDLASMMRFPGTWRLARQHWRSGAAELRRSLHKATFVRSVQRLVPDVRSEHLVRSPAGVRAQAVGRDGALYDDFVVLQRPSAIHVVNAPSPAATASLAIGDHVAQLVLAQR